jgi:ABC-type antimicrobial peptide transport system permease subunit
VRTPDHPITQQITVDLNGVAPNYFAVTRTPILSGRPLAEGAADASATQVVINEVLARTLFGTDAATGRTFEFDEYSNVGPVSTSRRAVVVGVAGSVASSRVRGTRVGVLYKLEEASSSGDILIRVDRIWPAIERIREVAAAVAPDLPITTLQAVSDQRDRALSSDRALMTISVLLSCLVVVLAATGVAAVVGQTVSARKRDFGIRVALGARPSQVLRQVLTDIAIRSAVGVAVGLLIYTWASAWIESRLYGVSALDPLTLASAVSAITAVAIGAGLVPARRAATVDPALSLRSS